MSSHVIMRDGFEAAAASLEAALSSAAFVAVDFEMSGIGPWRQDTGDIPQARYEKMAAVASKYTIMQFGIAVFTEREGGGYESRPYNFITFPSGSPDVDVTVSASTMRFHADNKLDFNAWLAKGIPFVTATEAERLRKRFLEPPEPKPKRAPQKPILTRESDIAYVTDAFERFDKWVAGGPVAAGAPAANGSADAGAAPTDEFVFPPCNSWLRRAVYQEIELRGLDGVVTESRKVDGGQSVVATRLDAAGLAARDAAQREDRERKYASAVGATRVFRALAACKKPLVGHNCLYDLMFMLCKFDDALPSTYDAFAARVDELFPVVFDTKLLATVGSVAPWRHPGTTYEATMLGNLYNGLGASGKLDGVRVADGETFAHYREADNAASFHEAGWDAHCTGAAFAVIAPGFVVDAGSGATAGPGAAGVAALAAAFGNWLHGTGTPIRWNLRGVSSTDAAFAGGATVHVSGLRETDKTGDVAAPFAHAGRAEVKWISASEAFVSVFPREGSGKRVDVEHLMQEAHGAFAAGHVVRPHVRLHRWEEWCGGIPRPLSPITEAPPPKGTWVKVKGVFRKVAWLFGAADEGGAVAQADREAGASGAGRGSKRGADDDGDGAAAASGGAAAKRSRVAHSV